MLPVIITEITSIEIFRICQTIEIIRKLIWKKIFGFQEMRNLFHFFTFYLSIDAETVDDNLQLELIEIQCDSILKQKYMEVRIPNFYNLSSVNRYPNVLCCSLVAHICANNYFQFWKIINQWKDRD